MFEALQPEPDADAAGGEDQTNLEVDEAVQPEVDAFGMGACPHNDFFAEMFEINVSDQHAHENSHQCVQPEQGCDGTDDFPFSEQQAAQQKGSDALRNDNVKDPESVRGQNRAIPKVEQTVFPVQIHRHQGISAGAVEEAHEPVAAEI